MSLLMQALKKAERAKQNSLHDEEMEKPSEAFDDLLAPPPEPAGLSLEPAPELELSLSPLDDAPAAGTAAASPQAAPARPQEPPMVPLGPVDDGPEAIPALIPATEAIHDPTPPQSRIEPAQKAKPAGRSAAAAASAGPVASAARQAESRAAGRENHSEPRVKADEPSGAPPGAAARARAAASAVPADKAGLDPARLRIAVLSGIMLLILAMFGYIYWQATSAPGAGASLPMVPMPPPNAGSATPAILVEAPPGAGTDATAGPPPAPAVPSASPTSPAFPYAAATQQQRAAAPGQGARTPSDEDIQRQLEQATGEAQAPQPGPAPSGQAQQAATPAPARAAPMAGGAADIQVRRSAVAPTISPPLLNGYQAYLAGDLAAAARHYDSALNQDPNNRDALLGAAAVAVRSNQGPQAAAAYLRLLELDPNDADALAGLIGLRPGDTGQSELRLKAILQKAPGSGPVLFALGNLYARQGRWPEAQQTYFRAYTASPDNADYAYNLAVGLDRLNQPRLALDYYQRALALAGASGGNGGFDRNAVQSRMQALAAATGAGPN